jgi:hypothetical protein
MTGRPSRPPPRPPGFAMTARPSPELIKHRQLGYWRAKLKPDRHPADAVMRKLCKDLQHASEQDEAEAFERATFAHLMRYLTTLERPDEQRFKLLD